MTDSKQAATRATQLLAELLGSGTTVELWRGPGDRGRGIDPVVSLCIYPDPCPGRPLARPMIELPIESIPQVIDLLRVIHGGAE